MKRVILAAVTLISVVFAGTANAQSTANTTLHIKLKPIHTIVVHAEQKAVTLEYITKDDYKKGVDVDKADHLQIFSTGAFEIQVKSNATLISNPSGTEINASTVTVTPSAGSKSNGATTYSPKSLSDSPNKIVSSTKGGRDLMVSVNYKGAGDDAYFDKFVSTKGDQEHTFTTDVTYTIIAL